MRCLIFLPYSSNRSNHFLSQTPSLDLVAQAGKFFSNRRHRCNILPLTTAIIYVWYRHGLCGLARVSKRAFVAVITFMGSGMLTASFITLYVDFLRCSPQDSLFSKPLAHILGLIILVSTIIGGGMSLAYAGRDSKILDADDLVNEESALAIVGTDETIDNTAIARSNETKKYLYASIAAALFAIGLAVSGMIYQNKIIDFLDLTRFANLSWDGTLAMVMGGGLLFSAYGYHWVKGIGITDHQNAMTQPLKSDHFNMPCETKTVDTQLIVGNILFGCGWAIAGFW